MSDLEKQIETVVQAVKEPETIDVTKLSAMELEKLLAQKKKEEAEQRAELKAKYEEQRDKTVKLMIASAVEISAALTAFKAEMHQHFDSYEEILNEYGGIRSNSKGGFQLVSSDGTLKAVRRRNTQPVWDERSEKAIELINDFLRDTVKKKDIKIFEILFSFIQKNDKGDLEYSKVMNLLSHKNKYDDPRWVEGLQLLQESYSIQMRAYGFEFYKKGADDKWQKIEINFSAL
ncbi:MAG TPA: DUF3164 family protein [Crocinitomicaceae bacterium]|nr:DUF3164 family protein [Crocinitomicaceae bacterium]